MKCARIGIVWEEEEEVLVLLEAEVLLLLLLDPQALVQFIMDIIEEEDLLLMEQGDQLPGPHILWWVVGEEALFVGPPDPLPLLPMAVWGVRDQEEGRVDLMMMLSPRDLGKAEDCLEAEEDLPPPPPLPRALW